MADIELVIKIPEDVFKRTVFYREFRDLNDSIATIKALEKAISLPKGHGDLKDIDWIDDNCEYHYSDKDGSWCYTKRDIDNAPTIIKADTQNVLEKEDIEL